MTSKFLLDSAQIKLFRSNDVKFDADDAIFFARQLEEIDTQVFEKHYPQYKFANGTIVPITSRINPGAESYTYTMYDFFGIAKIISSYADDIPMSGVGGEQTTVPIKSISSGYMYSIQDIRAAVMGNVPLDNLRAFATRRNIDQKKDNLIFEGDADHGLIGFNALTNATEVVFPLDAATSTSRSWSAKTPDEILRDMNSLVTAVIEATLETEEPDTMLLPISQYQLISTTPRSANSDTTIMEYFLKNSPTIKNIIQVPKLGGAGASSSDRVIIYKKDPEYISVDMPIVLETLAPQVKNLATTIIMHSRMSGLIDRYPLARAYADNI